MAERTAIGMMAAWLTMVVFVVIPAIFLGVGLVEEELDSLTVGREGLLIKAAARSRTIQDRPKTAPSDQRTKVHYVMTSRPTSWIGISDPIVPTSDYPRGVHVQGIDIIHSYCAVPWSDIAGKEEHGKACVLYISHLVKV